MSDHDQTELVITIHRNAHHRTVAAFDAAMILLQPVIEVLAVAVPHTGAQGRPDRPGVTVVPVRGNSVGCDTGNHLGQLEERLRGGHVAVLAEHHVDQRPERSMAQ